MSKRFVRPIILLLSAQTVAMAGPLSWAPPGPYPSKSTCPPVLFDQPEAVAVDNAGDIYIANEHGWNAVQEVTAKGTIRTLLDRRAEPTRSGHYFGPSLAVGPDGGLYIAIQHRGTVEKLAADGTLTVVAGKPGDRRFINGSASVARLRAPRAVAIHHMGAVYIADTRAIREIHSNGAVTTVAGDPQANARPNHPSFNNGPKARATFLSPDAIAIDAVGNIYVVDNYNGRSDGQIVSVGAVREITRRGMVRTVAGTFDFNGEDMEGNGEASFSALSGVAIGTDGVLYVAETTPASVKKIAKDGGVSTLISEPNTSFSSTGLITVRRSGGSCRQIQSGMTMT